MELAFIPLEKLFISPLNMRKIGKTPDIDDIYPSIRDGGVWQSLLVRDVVDDDRYEIIDGGRRYSASCRAAEDGGKSGPLPCLIMDEGDDADAIEASILTNFARLDPDPMTQYEAFARLERKGRAPDEIAATFGITEQHVRQRLAMGNLLPAIRNAYRREDIDDRTIKALTIATKGQQGDWWKLFKDPNEREPRGRQLQSWLCGGNIIKADVALFPVKGCKLSIVEDLFVDQTFFGDSTEFWKLQNEAIATMRDQYLAGGWSDVEIQEAGRFWYHCDYVKVPKTKGGRVYIDVGQDGSVTCHEGYLTRIEAEKKERAEAKGEKAAAAPIRPEITGPMVTYLELHRHAAVSAEILSRPETAMKMIAAHMVAGSPLWRIEADPRKADKEAIADSLAAGPATAALAEERKAVSKLLGIKMRDHLIYQTYGAPDALQIYAKLWPLSEADVIRVMTYAMTESLQVGNPLVEAIGEELAVDMAKHWQPDDAFWSLLKGKGTVNAVVAEVASKAVADQNVTGTIAQQLKIVKDCLAGANGRDMAEAWLPRWMRFPFADYLNGSSTRIDQARKKVDAIKTKTAKSAS